MINSKKVKGRLVELGLTQRDVSKIWNCALPTVSQKINQIRPITLQEADLLAKLLGLDEEEYYEFFLKMNCVAQIRKEARKC